MARNGARAAPCHIEAARHDQHPAKDTEPRSVVTVARPAGELAARRELRAWIAAAGWLNARGLAAAVPGSLVPLLVARGLVVWDISGKDAA